MTQTNNTQILIPQSIKNKLSLGNTDKATALDKILQWNNNLYFKNNAICFKIFPRIGISQFFSKLFNKFCFLYKKTIPLIFTKFRESCLPLPEIFPLILPHLEWLNTAIYLINCCCQVQTGSKTFLPHYKTCALLIIVAFLMFF